MYRLLVTGWSRWKCNDLATEVIAGALRRHPDLVLVHEGKGDCSWAFHRAAQFLQVPIETVADLDLATVPDLNIDLCLACDPLLPPGKRPFAVAQATTQASIPTFWINRADGPAMSLADTPSLRPTDKTDFQHYWEHVHI